MVIIIGASGHSGEILQILKEKNDSREIYFYDDVNNLKDRTIFNLHTVVTSFSELSDLYQKRKILKFTLGLGFPKFRENMYIKLISLGLKPISTISKHAYINDYKVSIEDCVNILPGVKISNDVSIGIGCLIYYNAIITHDVIIGNFCEISPNANLLGNCKIGHFVHVGANATILPNIKIGNNSIIGAGSVVTKDIPDNVIAYGCPAKIVKNINP